MKGFKIPISLRRHFLILFLFLENETILVNFNGLGQSDAVLYQYSNGLARVQE